MKDVISFLAMTMLFVIVLMSASYAADKVFGNFITAIKPPPYMQSCMKDEECTSIDPKCDNCCGNTVINKKYIDQYTRYKSKQCGKDQKTTCECMPETVYAIKCMQGKCTQTHTRPNRKEIKQ